MHCHVCQEEVNSTLHIASACTCAAALAPLLNNVTHTQHQHVRRVDSRVRRTYKVEIVISETLHSNQLH